MNDSHSNRHFVVGIVILVIGVILLFDQLGFTEANKLWPLVLIYFGVNKFVGSRDTTGRFWGGFLALLGISLELEVLGLGHIRLGTIWPVFLICIGVLLVMRRYEARRWMESHPPSPPPVSPGTPASEPTPPGGTAQGPATNVSEGEPQQAQTSPPPPPPPPPGPGQAGFYAPSWDPQAWRNQRSWEKFQRRMDRMNERMNRKWGTQSNWAGQSQNNWQARANWQSGGWSEQTQPRLNDVNVFWGGRRRIVSRNFEGGEVIAIFGGFEIDLTQADFPGNQVEVEIITIFGGGEIRVPENWDVVVDSVGIFGGTADRTRHPDPRNQTQVPGTSAAAPVKRLIIKGVSIFGGLTLKN